MRPLTIICGIIMGSAGAIMLGLAAVMFIFLVTGLDEPRVRDEYEPLAGALLLFTVLSGISVAAFYSLVKQSKWRWYAQLALWPALFATGAYFWPV